MSHYPSYTKVSHAKVDTTPKCSTPKCSICQSGNMSKYHPRQSAPHAKVTFYAHMSKWHSCQCGIMSKWFHAKVVTTSKCSRQSVPRQSILRQNVCQPYFFTIFTFFTTVIYWSIFQDVMDQKMTGAKKISLTKNQFFHACQPRGGIFQIGSYCGLSFMIEVWNFDQLFPNGETFFQKKIRLKSLLLVGILVGLMWS